MRPTRVALVMCLLIVVGAMMCLEDGWQVRSVEAHAYRNCGTTESTHNDAGTTLFCDDFEVNGVALDNGHGKWYGENGDVANSNGGVAVRTKGWSGTIDVPITPDGAEECTGGANIGGVAGTPCAASKGVRNGTDGSGNEADHSLFTGTSTTTTVTHFFIRYYAFWKSGYQFGTNKMITLNAGTAGIGGIKWGDLHFNCGFGSAASDGFLQWQPVGGGFSNCLDVLSGMTTGRWYFIEMECLLSTNTTSNDGYLKVWVNDCGTNGLTNCVAGTNSPTLRLNQQNMSWDRQNSGQQFGSVWVQSYSNPGSVGTELVDQFVVSTAGPIGFMGAAGSARSMGMSGGLRSTGDVLF